MSDRHDTDALFRFPSLSRRSSATGQERQTKSAPTNHLALWTLFIIDLQSSIELLVHRKEQILNSKPNHSTPQYTQRKHDDSAVASVFFDGPV